MGDLFVPTKPGLYWLEGADRIREVVRVNGELLCLGSPVADFRWLGPVASYQGDPAYAEMRDAAKAWAAVGFPDRNDRQRLALLRAVRKWVRAGTPVVATMATAPGEDISDLYAVDGLTVVEVSS